MRDYRRATPYALGRTPQAMITLRRAGVPTPDVVPGDTASVYNIRADMTRVGDGFAHVQWIWDVLAREHLAWMLSFLDGEESKQVYVQTNITTGVNFQPLSDFNVYYGMMYRPVLTGQDGGPIARTPYAYQSLKIQFSRLVVQPGYL